MKESTYLVTRSKPSKTPFPLILSWNAKLADVEQSPLLR